MYAKSNAVIPALALASFLSSSASAVVVVNYTVGAGGNNPNPLNGMSAQATFDISGTTLSVLLENTSTGVPMGAETADSLLVSVGFNLPTGIAFISGDLADIGAGSQGLGLWGALVAGDSVAEEWLYTNNYGGDLMETYAQVISTSSGQNAPPTYAFVTNALNPMVNGPSGGIAADPVLLAIPATSMAVSNSIYFELTLSETITQAQLEAIADASRVEFGSDFQYLDTPAPGALALLALAGLASARRRRS